MAHTRVLKDTHQNDVGRLVCTNHTLEITLMSTYNRRDKLIVEFTQGILYSNGKKELSLHAATQRHLTNILGERN